MSAWRLEQFGFRFNVLSNIFLGKRYQNTKTARWSKERVRRGGEENNEGQGATSQVGVKLSSIYHLWKGVLQIFIRKVTM